MEPKTNHVVDGSIQTTIEKIKVTKKESDPSSNKAKRDPRIINKSPALGRRSDSKRLGTLTSGGPLNIKKLTLQDQKNNRNSINRQQESKSQPPERRASSLVMIYVKEDNKINVYQKTEEVFV